MSTLPFRSLTVAPEQGCSDARITVSHVHEPRRAVFVGGCLVEPGDYVHVGDVLAAFDDALGSTNVTGAVGALAERLRRARQTVMAPDARRGRK